MLGRRPGRRGRRRRARILAGDWRDHTAANQAGSVSLFSGADGSELHTLYGDMLLDFFGWDAAGVGDFDDDGSDGFAVGAFADDDGRRPVAYCESGPNRVGPGASIGWQGSTSVAAGDFVLTVDGATPRRFGVFFTGGERQQVPFLDGYLCIQGPLRRATSWVRTDQSGSTSAALGSTRRWRWRHAPAAGETWNFQFLYFDRRRGPWRRRLNLSDALPGEPALIRWAQADAAGTCGALGGEAGSGRPPELPGVSRRAR